MAELESLAVRQRFALLRESETAAFLVTEGLMSLDALSAANDFRHLPLQLLAQGFERTLKLGYSLGQLHFYDELPKRSQMRSHNVRRFLSLTLEVAHDGGGFPDGRPAAREDEAFFRNDARFLKLIDLLSDFGAAGRYYDLDAFLDAGFAETTEPPIDAFEQIESDILDSHPEWLKEIATPRFSDFYPVLYGDLIESFQRGARAIARLFTWGFLGHGAKQMSSPMFTLLIKNDDQLREPPRHWFDN